MGKLTDKEREIVNTEYERHKYYNICPHTTNPLQLKELCKRCRSLDILGISVYQMPLGDWGCSIMGNFPHKEGIISDGFKSRKDAEEWALSKALPIKDKQGNRYRNIGSYIDLET